MKKHLMFCSIFLFFFLFFASGDWLPTDIRIDTGDLEGSHASGYVQIANNGDNVYVVWSDCRNGCSDIYFSNSNDKGETWKDPFRIDTKPIPGSSQSWEPKISVSGSNIYVVWRDWRDGLGDIYFNSSFDGGETWQASDIRLDTGDPPGTNISGHPEISSSGSNVYVTWYDDRNDGPDIYFNYSGDGGITWQAPFRIDTKANPGETASYRPQICSFDSNVYVAWEEARYLGTTAKFIFFNYSTDGGATWQNNDIQLDLGGVPEEHWSTNVHMCCDKNNVYAVWEDERNGEDDIYFNFSTDSGVTWEALSIRIDTGDMPGAYDSYFPQISCCDNNVYVVWQDERNFEYNYDIYFNCSRDGGLTWQTPVRIDTGDSPGANDSLGPKICSNGSNVNVVWCDERNGKYDIFFNRSTDSGMNWEIADVRLDTGDFPGANESLDPQISCSENAVYAVWPDYRDGEPDIYFNSNIYPKFVLTIFANKGGTTSPEPGMHSYYSGTKVAVSAVPDEGYKFSHWSGDAPDNNNPIILAMDSDKSVTANFKIGIQTYTLSIKSGTGGTTNPQPGIYSYEEGTKIIITAIPDSYYRFSHWTGDVSGIDSPKTIIMDSDKSINAKFVRQHTVNIISGPGGTIDPPPGIHTYDRGTKIIITAIPSTHHYFSHWSGGVSGANNPMNIMIRSDMSIAANFARIIYAPISFTGQKVLNRSLSQAEYINVLTWQPNPNNLNILKYRIYQIEGESRNLIIELNSDTSFYWHRKVEKERLYNYAMCAVNNEDRNGEFAYVSVK